MPKYNAYWINPTGHILPIKEPTHIVDIIKNPQKFKLTKDYIEDIYKKYNEKFGIEGKAREEIMTDLAKAGWIRIRFKYGQGEFWAIQPYRLDKRSKENIWYWVVKMSDGTLDNRPYDQLIILPIGQTGLQISSSFKDALAGHILETKFKMKKNINFFEILKVKNQQNRKLINELSLSRIYQHIKGIGSKSFGILSAYRRENTKQQNYQLTGKLESDLQSNKLGFFTLKGHWVECQTDVPYDKCPPDELKATTEVSVFVPNISKDLLLKLVKKYNQDGAVYGEGDDVGLVFKNGRMMNIGKFHPGKIAQAYSSFKGRNFAFEYVANSWIEKLMEINYKNWG